MYGYEGMCHPFINLRFWFYCKYFEIKPTKFRPHYWLPLVISQKGARAYQEVKNVCSSENLTYFVSLKHPFWDSLFCLNTGATSYFYKKILRPHPCIILQKPQSPINMGERGGGESHFGNFMLRQSRSKGLPWIWLIKDWLKMHAGFFLSKWFYLRAMQNEEMSFVVYILVYLNSVSSLISLTFHHQFPEGYLLNQ